MKNGTINIEVVGLPADDGSILWVQDDGFGGKVGQVAPVEFSEVILARMEHVQRIEAMKKKAAEAAVTGVQGRL